MTLNGITFHRFVDAYCTKACLSAVLVTFYNGVSPSQVPHGRRPARLPDRHWTANRGRKRRITTENRGS
eukprot:7125723-Pyramimonas_sp.AAC.1